MAENIKCECGHNNPVGTVLCEYCGKPLADDTESEPIEKEMRYEGMARRSQTFHTSPIDQIWSFFSSVKVAVALIVITLLVAALGTILPQEQFIPSNTPEVYYEEEYGFWGKWFYELGLAKMYSSWWFVTLIALIGVSLVVCSLDRAVPLYKALNNQRVVKSKQFVQRQRITYELKVAEEEKEAYLESLTQALQKRRYHVRREQDSLLAEKGRFSRWGPYINHIGLIILLIGIMLQWLPGWVIDEYVWVKDQEIQKVPKTDYYVKNVGSTMELYDQEEQPDQVNFNQSIVKKYETKAILYEKDAKGQLQPVKEHTILVNKPLQYQGVKLYQSDFRPNELAGIHFQIEDEVSGETMGRFLVDLSNLSQDQVYQVNDLELRVLEYYPDFDLENNQPITLSQQPNRPAFIFSIQKKGEEKGERSWVISGMDFPNPEENRYNINFAGLETVNHSGLMVRMDRGLPLYFIGSIIFLIGVSLGFYWQHRRVWVNYAEGGLIVGAHTNKNWFPLRQELQQINQEADIGGIDLGTTNGKSSL